jgi:hypothetical protein
MRTSWFAAAWAFVLGVAGYDVLFAWHFRDGFLNWELNPVARWAAGLYGLGAVFIAKALAVVFAAAVGMYCHQRRHRLEAPYTFTVGGVHLLLSLHYVALGLAR